MDIGEILPPKRANGFGLSVQFLDTCSAIPGYGLLDTLQRGATTEV